MATLVKNELTKIDAYVQCRFMDVPNLIDAAAFQPEDDATRTKGYYRVIENLAAKSAYPSLMWAACLEALYLSGTHAAYAIREQFWCADWFGLFVWGVLCVLAIVTLYLAIGATWDFTQQRLGVKKNGDARTPGNHTGS